MRIDLDRRPRRQETPPSAQPPVGESGVPDVLPSRHEKEAGVAYPSFVANTSVPQLSNGSWCAVDGMYSVACQIAPVLGSMHAAE